MLASLWRRAISAMPAVTHNAALTPGNLLAAMLIPRPVLHISTPHDASPLETMRETAAAKSG